MQPQTRSLVLVAPGPLDTCSGGYEYDRRIIAGLRRSGWDVEVWELDSSFPEPTAAALRNADDVLASIPEGTTVVIDGLALGAMPDQVRRQSGRLRLVGLVHHPLARETGIDAALAARLERTERSALAAVDFVVVTSRGTAAGLAEYDVPPQRIQVVEPGTDPAPLARGSRSGVVRLIAVGTLIPRKGYDVLFAALAAVSERNWQLTCAGSLERDPMTAERLMRQLHDQGLTDRVRLAGELNANTLAGVYDESDVFVLPTRYEGYGMAVAEALARGLPVISTATGAVADLLAGTAGILVPGGDVPALTTALSRMIGDPALREALAAGARVVRDQLPTWDDAARHFAEAVERVALDGTLRR